MGCCPIGVGAGSVLCVVASCRLCLWQMGEEEAEVVMASSVVRAMVRAVSKRKIQATRAALTLVSAGGVAGPTPPLGMPVAGLSDLCLCPESGR